MRKNSLPPGLSISLITLISLSLWAMIWKILLG